MALIIGPPVLVRQESPSVNCGIHLVCLTALDALHVAIVVAARRPPQAQSRLPGRALRPLPPRELSTAGRKHLLLHASARNAASVWAKNASIFSRRACSRRITSSVEQLPRRTQITLGGGPCRTLSRWKSSSLLTITT